MKSLHLNTTYYRNLEEDFSHWLETLGFAESTVYGGPAYVREFLCWLEANHLYCPETVTGDDTGRYFACLMQRKNRRTGLGLSPNHLQNHLKTLRRFARFLRQAKGINIDIRAGLPTGTDRAEVLSKAEVQALYSATDNSILGFRDRAMLAVYYGCGLRRSEGTALDTGDILTGKGLVYVRNGKNGRQRYVPLSENSKKDLEAYIRDARPHLAAKQPCRGLFLSVRGSRIKGGSLVLRIHKLSEKAQINKTPGLHTLRHSIATHLLQSGMKLENIATFLGHSTLEATQIYTHLAYGEL